VTAAAHTVTTLPPVAEPPAPEQSPAPAPDHLERSIGVGIVWKLAGQVGVQSIRLVTVAILARLLVPADYGAAAIAVALASFAPTVGDMGMGSALVQSPTATQRERSTVFWSSLAFGCALAVLGALASVPVGRFLGDAGAGSMVACGALTFAIYSLGSPSQAIFIRNLKFRGVELRYWFALLVGSAVAIVAAEAGLGAWALVLQQIALLSASVAALWWRSGWRPKLEFSRDAFRPLFSFAIRIVGGRWARLLELVILSLLIGKLVDVAALGAWTFAMSTVILPLTVITIPIAEVLFSAFSRLQGQPERVAALWLDSLRFLAAVIVPVLVGLVVVAPDLIPAVFGAQWRVSVGIIQILSFYVIIRSLQSWNSPVLDAAGRPQVTLWTQVGALCLTPVAVVVGSRWSVEAVALCYVVGQLIAVEVPSFVCVLSELRVSPATVATHLRAVVAATVVMAAACLLGREALVALGVGMVGRGALTIAIGVLVYLIGLQVLAPDLTRRALRLARRTVSGLT
jgi:O-antigen/teichoic acid export membrane protein